MTYQQTIDYLYSLLPVFHRDGKKAFKADLSNTLKLCEALGNPQNKFKSIHIAGTNGKGSTSHFMAAILQSAGYKTGLYTSPHLKDYTERFRIDGQSISKAKIINFVKRHKTLIEELKPSFFELSVALAFDYFAQQKVDIAVIEVGLGGRLDSTNVITPLLSIITNIGFDHTDILGKTLPRIASSKAGIIKPNIPVVISQRHPETDIVFFDKAKETKSPIFFAEDTIDIQPLNSDNLSLDLKVTSKDSNETIFHELHSQLIGKYQLKNLKGVIKSALLLRELGFTISDEAIKIGIENVVTLTNLKGRFQILNDKPLIICDTGHNEHGFREILDHISKLNFKKKYFILGFVKDKDKESIFQMLPKDATYIFTRANMARSESPENLIKLSQQYNLSAYSILNVNEAIKKIKKIADSDDFIYVGGSTFLVAEIKDL